MKSMHVPHLNSAIFSSSKKIRDACMGMLYSPDTIFFTLAFLMSTDHVLIFDEYRPVIL